MHREDGQPIVPADQFTIDAETALVPIEVRSYAGHKADERPVSFDCEGTRFDVEEILFAWIEENRAGTTRRFCYDVVAGKDRDRLVILFALPEGMWFWRRRVPVQNGKPGGPAAP